MPFMTSFLETMSRGVLRALSFKSRSSSASKKPALSKLFYWLELINNGRTLIRMDDEEINIKGIIDDENDK
jgi:hypothetical protein